MVRIAVISTGGTFFSKPGADGLSPEFTEEDRESLMKEVGSDVELTIKNFMQIDSSNINPEYWHLLAEEIRSTEDSCDGIVVIQGTDTLAYSASMLSFMLYGIQIPLVLTGSQVPYGAALSDASGNFQCAVKAASSGIPGVFVAFDHSIMLGCRTSKVRSIGYHAFESINYPEVGNTNALGLHMNRDLIPAALPERHYNFSYSDRIAVLKLFPGMPSDIITFLAEHGYEGVYIEGFGLGGIPFLHSDILDQIEKASKQGIPVLVGSQCIYDGSDLNVYEVGTRIRGYGGITVRDMTEEAVVTKLMWALGHTKDRGEIQTIFETDMVHEITL